jgi:glycosyltransferase involved in cell wall biosynthesis
VSSTFRLGLFCPFDLRGFSGIPHHVFQTLRSLPDVEAIHLPPGEPYRPSTLKRVGKRLARSLSGRSYLWEKEPARCRHLSRRIDQAAEDVRVDAVLLFGSEGCAYSRTRVPIYCYCDSLFGTRIDLYPDQRSRDLSPVSLREGKLVQQLAINNLTKLFPSSRWAVERAVARFGYDLPPGKVESVLIGANLPAVPAEPGPGAVERDEPRFLWVGSYWERKGGEFAIDVVGGLRARGFVASLDVIGPVSSPRNLPWVRFHGRLAYEKPEQFRRLGQLYAAASALLLPTSGDTTPLVISEAFAFGCPAVTTPVGGIPEMVCDGTTGLVLPRDDPAAWARRVESGLCSGELWGMRAACRRQYETRLNWDTVCRKMLQQMAIPSRVAPQPIGDPL